MIFVHRNIHDLSRAYVCGYVFIHRSLVTNSWAAGDLSEVGNDNDSNKHDECSSDFAGHL